MNTLYLIHFTGLAALLLNVSGLVRSCDRTLRLRGGIAAVLWMLNNLLLGAHTAAALCAVSAGRQAVSTVTHTGSARWRLAACLGFMSISMTAVLLTWHGWPTLLMAAAAMISNYAMFYLHGRQLRLAVLIGSALWMYNAWTFDSWEQMIANVVTALAGAYGAWSLWQADQRAQAQAAIASGSH